MHAMTTALLPAQARAGRPAAHPSPAPTARTSTAAGRQLAPVAPFGRPGQALRRPAGQAPRTLAQPAPAVRVALRSTDALNRAGVAAVLADQTRLQLLSAEDEDQAAVVVLVEDRVRPAHLKSLQEMRVRSTGDSDPVFVLVTDELSDADLLTAVDTGVMAVLSRRDTGAAQLTAAVVAAAQGCALLPPRLQGVLAKHVRRLRTDVLEPNGLTLSGLTARERDVLRLVADGHDTEEIARRLAFSQRTVKYVLTHVMTRFDLHSRAHAVAFAVRAGAI